MWICCGPQNTEALNFLGVQHAASEPLSQEGMEQYLELGTLNTETDWHLQMLLSHKKTNNFRIVPVGRQPHFLSVRDVCRKNKLVPSLLYRQCSWQKQANQTKTVEKRSCLIESLLLPFQQHQEFNIELNSDIDDRCTLFIALFLKSWCCHIFYVSSP